MISISMSNVPLAQLSHIQRMPSVCLAYKPYIRIRTSFLSILKKQGSYGHEKSGNLKMHFPGREKSWILGKMAEVMEKSWKSIYLDQVYRAV